MRFLSPFALFGLALIALPIAIHLLVRRRAVRIDFPSIKFLRETPSFRLRPRRIQQPALLALRIAAFVFLVLGLSSPLISFGRKSPRTRIILLDASLSMRARGVAEAARQQARSLINNMQPGERGAVVAFSTAPMILTRVTSDKRQLIDAINRYQPTNGASDYVAGIRAAGTLLRQESDGETLVDLISDFQLSGLPGDDNARMLNLLIESVQVATHPVGAKVESNAFLFDEDVATGESGRTEVSVTDLVAVGDERSATRMNWTLDSSDGSGNGIEWRTEQNGQVTVRIQSLSPDDFDADDSRFMSFAVPRVRRVLLIERESDMAATYLRAAFETTESDIGVARLKVDRSPSLPTSESELNSYSLVALTPNNRPRPDEMRLLSGYVRSGGNVWFFMTNDIDTDAWNQFAAGEDGKILPFSRIERRDDKQETTGFGTVDSSEPVLQSMNDRLFTALRLVQIRQGLIVTPRPHAATMMRWGDGSPAFVSATLERGKVLLLATSPARAAGDLGASVAFPALVSSIIRSAIAPGKRVDFEIGQPVMMGLAPNAQVRITDPKGNSRTAQARDLIVSPALYISDAGIYRIESEGLTKYIALNSPSSESEFGLAPAADIERLFKLPASQTNSRSSLLPESSAGRSDAWRYFLLAAFVLLIVEGYAFRRGV